MSRKRIIVLAALALTVALTTGAGAAVLDSNVIVATDPGSGGSIQVTSTIFDNYGGDFTRYHFDYYVENLSYEPEPGMSNGLSGFNVAFVGPIAGLADQYAPLGWFLNCCGAIPPFGAEADINNSTGLGIPVGGTGRFGYTVPAGVSWTDAYTGSWAHTWIGDLQEYIFSQIDPASGKSVLTPIPEPSSVALALLGGLGLIAVARRRRR
jgi:hypothetical protein